MVTTAAAVVALGLAMLSTQARAQSFSPLNGGDNYYVSYFDVSTTVGASASGYGGPGTSGGAGDSLVRIVNPTHNDTRQLGTLCAMIYVFDDTEQLQECCGCPVTPDGLRTLSVINNLSSNFGTNGANLRAGVIKVVSSTLNFACPSNNQNCGANLDTKAINLETNGGLGCDPTGGFGTPELTGSTDTVVNPTTGLRAWISHTEAMAPVAPPFTTFITSTSVEEFADAPLDSTELSNLEGTTGGSAAGGCAELLANASTAGVCTCGSGDSSSLRRPTRSAKKKG